MADDADSREHSDGPCCHSHARSHFLVVAYGLQGHLNPARALARRLARAQAGAARVTLSVTVAAHGQMFPGLASPDEEVSDGLISYTPYSDGFSFGTRPRSASERARVRREATESLSAIVRRQAAAGRPVTCVVSALWLPAVDVAVEHGIPFAVFWIQSATALAAYYHYYNVDDDTGSAEQHVAAHIADPTHEVSLLGLCPLRIRDFPSFLVDATGSEHSRASVEWLRALFEQIACKKPKVLVNTLDALEANALQAIRHHLDVFTVGPMVAQQISNATAEQQVFHLYKQDEKGYMEWLDGKPTRSVVYMSYGSMLSYTGRQLEEILKGLQQSGRPYLWVVRKDGRDEEVERFLTDNDISSEQGMIVEWCDQLSVLSHSSVGCFVTHCGWNSTMEAVSLGVPMVAVPNWSDQALNAHLVEEWGVGVRAQRDDSGLLVGTELAKCIGMVTGDSERAANMYERANDLKDKVREAVIEGGHVELTLQNFVIAVQNPIA